MHVCPTGPCNTLFLYRLCTLFPYDRTPTDVFSSVLQNWVTRLTHCGIQRGLWHISFNICPLGPLRGKRQEAGTICPGKSDQCDCNHSFVKIRAEKSNKGLDMHTQAHCEFFLWQDRWLLWQRTYKQKDRELSAPPWEQQSRVNRTCTASDSISCSGLWEQLWRGCYRVVDALTEALLEGSGYGCAVETSWRQRRDKHIGEEKRALCFSGQGTGWTH